MLFASHVDVARIGVECLADALLCGSVPAPTNETSAASARSLVLLLLSPKGRV